MSKFVHTKAIIIYIAAGFIGLLTFQNCSSKLQSNLTELSSSGGIETMTCYRNPNAPECRTCGTKPTDDFNYVKCPASAAMTAQQMYTYICNPSTQMFDRMPIGQLNTSQCSSECTGTYPGGRRQVSCPTGQTGVGYQNFTSTCNTATGQWSPAIATGNPDYSGCMGGGGGACSNGAINPPSCTQCPSGQSPINGTCQASNSYTCLGGSTTMASAKNTAGQDQVCRFEWPALTTTTSQSPTVNGTPAGQLVHSCGPGGWTELSKTCPPPGVASVTCAQLTESQTSPNGQRNCSFTLPSTAFVSNSTQTTVNGVNASNNQAVNGATMTAICGSNGVWTGKNKVCPNPVKCAMNVPPQVESPVNNQGVKHICTYTLPETEHVGSATTEITVPGVAGVSKGGTGSGSVSNPNNTIASVTGKCKSDGSWTNIQTTCNPPANVNVAKCVGSTGTTQLSEPNNESKRRSCTFTWEASEIRAEPYTFVGRDSTQGATGNAGSLTMKCIADGTAGAKWDVQNNTYPATCPKLPDVNNAAKCPAGNNLGSLTPSEKNGTNQNFCYFEWPETPHDPSNPTKVTVVTGRFDSPTGPVAQGSWVSSTCDVYGHWVEPQGAYCPKPQTSGSLPKCPAMAAVEGNLVTNVQGASQKCRYSIPEHQLIASETTNGYTLPAPVQGTPGGQMNATCMANGQWSFREVANSCPAPALTPVTCGNQNDLGLVCDIAVYCTNGQLARAYKGEVKAEIVIPSPLPSSPVSTLYANKNNLIPRKIEGKAMQMELTNGYGGATYQCTADSATKASWKMISVPGTFCSVSAIDPDAVCVEPDRP